MDKTVHNMGSSASHIKKETPKNSDSLMGIELMTPDLTLSQEVLDYE